MTADHDDFVGPLASAQLADDVGGLDLAFEVRLHLQAHDDPLAAAGHALQKIRILGRDRSCGNFRGVGPVLRARPCAAGEGLSVRSIGSRAATAPWRAARDGPLMRNNRESP